MSRTFVRFDHALQFTESKAPTEMLNLNGYVRTSCLLVFTCSDAKYVVSAVHEESDFDDCVAIIETLSFT